MRRHQADARFGEKVLQLLRREKVCGQFGIDNFADDKPSLPQGRVKQLLGGLHRRSVRDEYIEEDIRIDRSATETDPGRSRPAPGGLAP